MPTVSTVATVSTTHEVKLAPKLAAKLRLRLRAYAALKNQFDALKAAMEKAKGEIDGLRDETGEQSLSIDGYHVTLVAPIRKKFDPKRFVQLGGELEIYNQAQISVPGRPYTKVSCPGEKDSDE